MSQNIGAIGLFGNTPTDTALRVVSDGDFGATPTALGTQGPWTGIPSQQTQNNTTYQLSLVNDGRTPFPSQFDLARNREDWNRQFICVRTGWWAPGHRRVDTSLGPMIDVFAITPKAETVGDPPRWWD